jgi:aspartyl/asparaginyl-tRNA synthetase
VASGPDGQTVLLRDRSGTARLATGPDPALVPEAAVEATGTVVAGEGGEVELAVDELEVVGPVLAELPITDRSPLEQRLDWRYLDLRRPANLLTFEVQTTAERAMRELWWDHGFLELHSPKLRHTPNKSGRELFTLDYFDGKAYLAQSPQFYKQMAMASGFERIFEIGPVFRANPLVTNRHDTEFTSVDVEISWIESHEDVMAFEETWLRHVLAAVKREHGEEIERVFGAEVRVPALPFPRITLERARAIAEQAGPHLTQPPGDLDAGGERAVGDHVAREHGHQFVFVTDYPQETRPFYHMRTEEGSPLTRSFDLLWQGMEVTTGAQREHRHDRLVQQARGKGVPVGPIGFYLDFFKFGCPPHGGYGFGLTRMLMALLGRDDVREVTYLHRGRHRLRP